MQYLRLTLCILISLAASNLASVILQNPKFTSSIHHPADGFIKVKANGSHVWRDSTHRNYSSVWQEAVIFKTILNSLRLMPLQTKSILKDLNQKIYGDGDEHRFPPFLERIIQRIQTYFSIYRYTDTSQPQPLTEDKKSTSTTARPMSTATSTTTALSAILNETLTLGQNEIVFNLTSSNSGFDKNDNKTFVHVDKYKKPSKTTASTTTTRRPAGVVYGMDDGDGDEDEENEFIEIKNVKSV